MTDVIRGTVYAKCVYTVPVTAVDANFPLTWNKVNDAIMGTVYAKCV